MKNKRYFLAIIVLFISLLNAPVCEAVAEPVFSLATGSASAVVGDWYTVKIHVNNAQDIYGFEAVVAYDPDKAEFIWDKSFSEVYKGFSIAPKIETGKVSMAFTLVGNVTPISGNTDIYIMKFKAISKGKADVVFESIKVVDSKLKAQVYSVNSTVSVEHKDKSEEPGPSPEPGPVTPVQPSEPEIVLIGDKPTINTVPVLDSAGAAKTEISAATLTKAKEQAKADENGVKKVKIAIPEVSGAKEYKLTLPVSSVANGSSRDVIEIGTDAATLEIAGNMLQSDLEKGTSKVTFSIAPANLATISVADKEKIGNRPVIELKLTGDNGQIEWNNPGSPVIVSIDYKPTAEELKDPEHIVVWYIDGAGNITPVPNGRYDADTGKVVFKATHFSSYATAFVQKTFIDIKKHSWAVKAIEVMASKGVIGGTSATTFTPAADITRADFMVLLVKALDLSAKVDSNFIDVNPTAYYAEAVGIAKKLGITAGVGDNRFDPKAKITRQDMMTLIHKAMNIANKNLTAGTNNDLEKFADKAEIKAYAVESIQALVKNGIVAGDGTKLNPLGNATRAEVAVIIYKIYNK